MNFRIRRGLDVDIPGSPAQELGERKLVRSVALLGADYRGSSVKALVGIDDHVRLGQSVAREASGFELTAPGTGRVRELQRGPHGSLTNLVVQLDDPEEPAVRSGAPPPADAEATVAALVASGLWTSLRARPFGRVADPATRPRAIFVTAHETDPLAARVDVVLAGAAADFEHGVEVLTRLTDGTVHVCGGERADLPVAPSTRVQVHQFAGPHPSGLVGTHMHLIDPVGRGRTSWHVGYGDVVAIGRFFRTGELSFERVVALAGPRVARPRLVPTRLGASVEDLVDGELLAGDCRVVSGSVLSGRQATSWGRHLGRYHRAIGVLAEPRGTAVRESRRGGRGWSLGRRSVRAEGTALHGRPTAQVPTGAYERVLPLDVLPTPFLRALLVGDLETAEGLGLLELEEEDLALCTFACPSKIEYGAYLRNALDRVGEAG